MKRAFVGCSRVRATPAVLAALLAAALLPACEGERPAAAPDPRPVYTFEVKAPVPTTAHSFSGLVRAAEGVDLGFEISGRVLEMNADDGVRYEQGAVLARIDATGYLADLHNAEAQFASADAEMERTLRLYENSNASKSALDSAMAARGAAKANLDIARKRVGDATLRMPYPGVIGKVLIKEQQVVVAGQPVLAIRGESGLEMEIGVPARWIEQVRLDQPARIRLGSLPDLALQGHVSEISPQISPNTTYAVTVSVHDPPPKVLEGMDGEATLEMRNPGGPASSIPLGAVTGAAAGQMFVWTVRPDPGGGMQASAHRRPVELGQLRAGGEVEVLAGLEVGELVVVRGLNHLEEGQSVLVDPRRRQ